MYWAELQGSLCGCLSIMPKRSEWVYIYILSSFPAVAHFPLFVRRITDLPKAGNRSVCIIPLPITGSTVVR